MGGKQAEGRQHHALAVVFGNTLSPSSSTLSLSLYVLGVSLSLCQKKELAAAFVLFSIDTQEPILVQIYLNSNGHGQRKRYLHSHGMYMCVCFCQLLVMLFSVRSVCRCVHLDCSAMLQMDLTEFVVFDLIFLDVQYGHSDVDVVFSLGFVLLAENVTNDTV